MIIFLTAKSYENEMDQSVSNNNITLQSYESRVDEYQNGTTN